jgi:alcohol dehydrogenase (cytochrome c)
VDKSSVLSALPNGRPWDDAYKACDVDTGKILWQTRLGSTPHGYHVNYAAGGKLFVAVPNGLGVFKLMTAQQSPDIY